MNGSPELAEALARQLTPEAHAWLERVLGDGELLRQRARVRVAFAQVARKFAARGADVVSVQGARHTLLDLARTQLLLAALAVTAEPEHVELVDELLRTGAQGEQCSVLRALPRLPGPERFATLAISACRTNSLEVFRAIAIDNEYPARHFPPLHFHQLVLKAIFLGVSVHGIVGLRERITPELRRMVDEYASERRAAGRSVPADVDFILSAPQG
jgi:hypothetical protein